MKRFCKVCGKTLAELNKNKDLCFAHDQRYPQYEYHPITRCTSYKNESWDWNHGLDSIFPRPGIASYNERAFIRVLLYPDLEGTDR